MRTGAIKSRTDLRVTGRMGENNQHLAQPQLRRRHVILDRRIVAGEATFVTQLLPDTLRRAPLRPKLTVFAVQVCRPERLVRFRVRRASPMNRRV